MNAAAHASTRFIARLDVKGENLIKAVHLEGLRVVGDPQVFAKRYYEQGADEILYMDLVASLYGRNNLKEIVRRTAQHLFIPLTVGGGIRSVDDVKTLLAAGADKVAINTAAVAQPGLINAVAQRFGAQCLVLSIEAKRQGDNRWEIYTDCARESSGRDAVDWAKEAVSRGAGEILVTSIDQEGTRKGFDNALVRAIADAVSVPVIASGGYGAPEHIRAVCEQGRADALAFADALHFNRTTLAALKRIGRDCGLRVRGPHPAREEDNR